MPSYDFRCKNCGARFSLTYKSVGDYESAAPVCATCGGAALARLIGRVAIARPGRDYTRMNANEMLSVFESGDSRQVGEMFQQVGGGNLSPDVALPYHDATERLLRGEKLDTVERDLRSSTASGAEASPAPTATTPPASSD